MPKAPAAALGTGLSAMPIVGCEVSTWTHCVQGLTARRNWTLPSILSQAVLAAVWYMRHVDVLVTVWHVGSTDVNTEI